VNHPQGHKANYVFAPKGAWQSGGSASKKCLEYEPFGSLLPGRNYSSRSYVYGFNGKRKDDEIHGATGTSYDFGARLYDPRVSRWLSLDPKASKYPSLSAYAAFGLNPIYYIDPGGETLKVAWSSSTNEIIARQDVLRLLPPGEAGHVYEAALTITDAGDVVFNITAKQAAASGDAGVQLLYGLTSSSKNYQHTVADLGFSKTREGSEEGFDLYFAKDNNQLLNLSKTRMSEVKGAPGSPQQNRFDSNVPVDNALDGEVIIYSETDLINAPRESVVFHELEENYQRTENSLPFSNQYDPSVKEGAHQVANRKGAEFSKGDPRKAPPGGVYEKKSR